MNCLRLRCVSEVRDWGRAWDQVEGGAEASQGEAGMQGAER
jgi:hypothetical protein